MDTPTTAPTRQEVLQQFRARGISVAQWSRDHGFAYPLVRRVLYSKGRILHGESHRIAVALGLKTAVDHTDPHF